MAKPGLDEAIKELITSYYDLNSPFIDELHEEPSPLEFMRYVAKNRPFVVRKGAENWKARKTWNAKYLSEVMEGQLVNVAMTPHGNADSIISHPSGPIFVKPHETDKLFTTALQNIQSQELNPDHSKQTPTSYLQTQNDNLRSEYTPLYTSVPPTIPFARIALEQNPDAINFWLGNSHSVTALHKDNYENIYVQILGKKHFVLLPPVEMPCVNERRVRGARYVDAEGEEMGLRIQLDDPEEWVPFAMWDPDRPDENATRFSQYSRPMRVTLEEGDMLYLPALWYHKVSQSCSDEGICCAVNYWYDLEFSGSFWPLCGFARSVGLLALEEQRRDQGKDGSDDKAE